MGYESKVYFVDEGFEKGIFFTRSVHRFYKNPKIADIFKKGVELEGILYGIEYGEPIKEDLYGHKLKIMKAYDFMVALANVQCEEAIDEDIDLIGNLTQNEIELYEAFGHDSKDLYVIHFGE